MKPIPSIGCALLFVLYVFFVNQIFAQPELEFYRYPPSKLPGTKTQVVYKDNLGFLWIGKPDGLVRHDGINFKTYKNDPRDSTSLSNNDVRAIFKDSRNRLWIGTMTGGINCFDYETETFVYYPMQTDLYQVENTGTLTE